MHVKIPRTFGFYAILTDPVVGYEPMTELLVEKRIAFAQLRMKDRPEGEIARTARALRRITAGSATRLIINDYPAIAAEIGADGVHIGQDDMSYEQARTIVGNEAIVGISTHSPEQTRTACSLEPDYIGIGPVFPTTTKKIPDPPLGIQGMREMLTAATVPAVVLGALDASNLPSVLQAGARNFSLVRPLSRSENPRAVLEEILAIYRENVA
jgi:thiamine-phosphate pyrophosphorylase